MVVYRDDTFSCWYCALPYIPGLYDGECARARGPINQCSHGRTAPLVGDGMIRYRDSSDATFWISITIFLDADEVCLRQCYLWEFSEANGRDRYPLS